MSGRCYAAILFLATRIFLQAFLSFLFNKLKGDYLREIKRRDAEEFKGFDF